LRELIFTRSVDLVWRANPGNFAAVADPAALANLARSAAATATHSSAAASMPAFSQAVTANRRTNDKVTVCANALDPALTDRLADDVIRRIDRRARIERERRGL
jgi:hypothetical protein